MSFPPYPIPANWLLIVATYHAYAYGVPDSILPYSFTGDISANTSAQWSAITWTDVRPQPSYATLSDTAFQQEALGTISQYFATTNQLVDHFQIASNTASVSSLTSSVSSMASSISTMNATLTTLSSAETTDASNLTTMTASVAGLTKTTTADNSRSLTTNTGAAGFQVSSTKPCDVKYTVSTSATASIGSSSTSAVVLEMCATNSAIAGDWVEVDRVETDQTVTLAIALQSVQVVKASLSKDNVPAGYYLKLRNIGTGTHTEAFVEGEKTIYG